MNERTIKATHARITRASGAKKVVIHIPVNESLVVHADINRGKVKQVLPHWYRANITARG